MILTFSLSTLNKNKFVLCFFTFLSLLLQINYINFLICYNKYNQNLRRGGIIMKERSHESKLKLSVYLSIFISSFALFFHFILPSSFLGPDEPQWNFLFQEVFAEERTAELENFAPNVNYLQNQWNLNLMNIGEAWADGYNGKGIKIAVLDTGFHHKHPDISLAGGDSVFPDEAWSYDHSGHGTHIAGIISAKSGTTYQGLAPGAEVYGIKIYHSDDMDEYGDVSTDVASVINGIKLAIEKNVDIIVISSGLSYHDEDLYQVIKEAHSKNIMIIAASGNGNLTVNYPASYSEVIAVTAIDENLNPALDIIYGKENEFSAPGVNIGGLSIPDSSYSYPYIYMSGSSQATPHVAGLAAIFMQKYNIRGEETRKVMQDQAIKLGDPGLYGHGLLYYQSKKTDEGKREEPVNPNSEVEEKQKKVDTENIEDSEARKPSSSREAAKDEETEELASYRKIKVTIEEGINAIIDEDGFPGIEMGGLLDVFMRGAESLSLNEGQIAEIRQKNLTLVLRQEGISWKIPPSNFVPGQANLRFYKGKPVGTPEKASNYSNIYTISIFQARTRQGIYPGWMEVEFDGNKLKMPNLSTLEAAYFDHSKSEWLLLEKEMDERNNKITLKTKHTGALGFFDSIEDETLIEEELEESVSSNNRSSQIIIIILMVFSSFLALFFIKKARNKAK